MDISSFLWHDYETFGANARLDRPCQFAAIRTDSQLNPIDDPIVWFCQPSADTLPHPKACWITGITPQHAIAHGMPEPKFAHAVFDEMSQAGTCTVGYNNLRFDDEVSRHLFWRNFIDPYQREYANGNSRFDLINVLRLTRALRPEGLAWAEYDDGQPSFKLEDLATANGLDATQAHDALVDVENTLALAQRLRQAQPKLWAWALDLRQKSTVDALLSQGQPLVYASAYFAQRPGSVALISPLGRHPTIKNQWWVWDLSFHPQDILESKGHRLGDDDLADMPLPVSTIKINACPMVAPLGVVDAETENRLGVDIEQMRQHHQWWLEHPDHARDLLAHLGSRTPLFDPAPDPEVDLYGGFVPRQDQALTRRIAGMTADELAALDSPFSDSRLNTLLFRYRARHWPHTLSDAEQADWHRDCRERLVIGREGLGPTLEEYHLELEQLAQAHPDADDLLTALRAWPDQLKCLIDGNHNSST